MLDVNKYADTIETTRKQGWGLAHGYISTGELLHIGGNAGALVDAPGARSDSQYYFDRQPDRTLQLARVERVAEALLPATLMARMEHDAERCLGETCRLFKDKLNIRYANSKGYAPHQDAARWDAFGDRFLSFGVFLSRSTPESGGFECACGPLRRGRLDPHDDDLNIGDFSRMPRVAVNAQAGDVLLIDGDAPHRTTENRTQRTVLHVLVTFGTGMSEDARDAYYRNQRRTFEAVRTGNLFVFDLRG